MEVCVNCDFRDREQTDGSRQAQGGGEIRYLFFSLFLSVVEGVSEKDI